MREFWRDLVRAWEFFKDIPPLKLALAGSFAVLGLVLAVYGRPVFHQLKISRLEPRALAWYEEGEYGKAILASYNLVTWNPDHYEANRILALLATRQGSPAALTYWERVVRLRPDPENRLERARAAMQFGAYGTALEELRAMDETAQNTIEFQRAALDLSMALNLLPQAEHHLTKLSELEPANRELPLLLARARLFHPNGDLREAAVDRLHSFLDDERLRPRALQGLVLHYLAHDSVEALPFARMMMEEGAAGVRDIWLALDLFEGSDPVWAGKALAELSGHGQRDPRIMAELVDWHLSQGRGREALAWLSTFPRSDPFWQVPVALAQTRVLTSLGEWEELRSSLAGQHWGSLEFLRLAHSRLALSRLGYPGQAAAEWRNAMVFVRGMGSHAIMALADLAAGWGEEELAVSLAWDSVERFPRQSGDLWLRLEAHAIGQGATGDLVRLFDLKRRAFPADEQAAAAWASLSLLRGENLREAGAVARRLQRENPDNPHLISARAWADYREGNPRAAALRLAQLPPEELAVGNRNLHLAAFWARADELPKARKALEQWTPSDHMLPEDRQLWEELLSLP